MPVVKFTREWCSECQALTTCTKLKNKELRQISWQSRRHSHRLQTYEKKSVLHQISRVHWSKSRFTQASYFWVTAVCSHIFSSCQFPLNSFKISLIIYVIYESVFQFCGGKCPPRSEVCSVCEAWLTGLCSFLSGLVLSLLGLYLLQVHPHRN